MRAKATALQISLALSSDQSPDGRETYTVTYDFLGDSYTNSFTGPLHFQEGELFDPTELMQIPDVNAGARWILSQALEFGKPVFTTEPWRFDRSSRCRVPELEAHFGVEPIYGNADYQSGDPLWALGHDYDELDEHLGLAVVDFDWPEKIDPVRLFYLSSATRLMIEHGTVDYLYSGEFSFDLLYGTSSKYAGGAYTFSDHELFSLGILVAEYYWKFTHELSALHGRIIQSRQEMGRMSAVAERRHQGKKALSSILTMTLKLIEDRPDLKFNNQGLAKALNELDRPPLKADQTKYSVSALRQHISNLRDSGKLPKSL